MTRPVALAALVLLAPAGPTGAADGPMLVKEVTVEAAPEAVWNAWTTAEGLRFVSSESRVELKIGGAYEWFLDGPADDRGRRGSEGSRILAFLPGKMLAFAWTFPPDIPSLRAAGETTQVVVLFDDQADGAVRVRLHVLGWQDGEEWRRGRDYFDRAWGYVLEHLRQRFAVASTGL